MPSPSRSHWLAPLAVAGLLAAALLAPDVGRARAEVRNPFQPRKAAGQNPASGQSPELLQFSGVMVLGGEVLVSLFDPKANKSFWLPVKGSQGSITVLEYNPAKPSVRVSVGGQARELELRRQQVAGAAFSPVPVAARPPQAAGAVGPVAVGGGLPGQPPLVPQPPIPQTPIAAMSVQQREAENARQMVQDLLELQVKHRKLNEETRRMKQQPGSEQAPAVPAPTPPEPAKQ